MTKESTGSTLPMALAGIGALAAVLVAQRFLGQFWTLGFWGKVGVVAAAGACLYVFSTLAGNKTKGSGSPNEPT